MDGFNLRWSFAFNSSVYVIFPFLFLRTRILDGSTSNAVADSSIPWNTKALLTPYHNPFMQFPNAETAEWIRIGSCDPCTFDKVGEVSLSFHAL